MEKRPKDWASNRLNYIFSEIERLSQQLTINPSHELLQEILFNSIQSTDGFILPIGRKGSLALFELSQEALKRCGLTGYVHPSEVVKFFQKHLSSIANHNEAGVSITTADKLLRDAGRAAGKKRRTTTHFFPVYITSDQDLDRIDLGDIQIHSKRSFEEKAAIIYLRKQHGSTIRFRTVRHC